VKGDGTDAGEGVSFGDEKGGSIKCETPGARGTGKGT